jgi:hypothetical protein
VVAAEAQAPVLVLGLAPDPALGLAPDLARAAAVAADKAWADPAHASLRFLSS